MNDNRNYRYVPSSRTDREEYKDVVSWIKKGSSVIDLACGDGSLLVKLQVAKKISHGYGIDVSETGVKVARKNGVKADIGRIDIPLTRIKDKTYDYAICNVTMQMVLYPEILLEEMCRIATYQIVSFSNFAFWVNRLEMLVKGRMPRLMLYGYTWYSTGHIHQCSISDFEEYCRDHQIKILDRKYRISSHIYLFPQFLATIFPNASARLALYLLEGKSTRK